ncbi:MAG TPA: D-alanine--D-serine ligase VanG [Ruminiclostridium sp.]
MDKKKVAIIFGGCSSEYEVSLQSASSVIENINSELYDAVLIGITREGEWFRYRGATEKIRDNSWFLSSDCVEVAFSPSRELHGFFEFREDKYNITTIDVAFPVLHGKNGEDGTVQGLLELAGIPFVGCDTLCSALCMDKDIAHRIAQTAGVRTPASITARKTMDTVDIIRKTETLKYPLFVKPAKAGSSLGITRVSYQEKLRSAIIEAFEHDNKVVIEESIDGFEVGCAILGNDELIIGEVDEIELQNGFFDFTEKYSLKTSKIHMPARIDSKTADRIKDTAVTLYKALCCSGFARVDMFLTPNGNVIFNEINTIPGFTSHSRYPNMLGGIGLSFAEIVEMIIRLALEK